MRIKNNMINKELRTTARIIKLFTGTFTESRMRFYAKMFRKFMVGKTDKALDCSQQWIERADGTKLRTCIFKSKETATQKLPGILWLHGGGYSMGVPEQAITMAKALIKTKNAVIVAPDYICSVEAPYPAALQDCYSALLWMKNNAEALGIDDRQIFVGGDSAGGGLTAAVSLYARDKNEVNIAFQMPLYPMMDDRMQGESAKDNNAPLWNSKSNAIAWKLYLGPIFGQAEVPEYAAPARALNYANLPPTATFVGDLEPFRDETIAYTENLQKAGVKVSFRLFEGCFHAFEQAVPKAKISKEAISFILSEYAFAVENYFLAQAK